MVELDNTSQTPNGYCIKDILSFDEATKISASHALARKAVQSRIHNKMYEGNIQANIMGILTDQEDLNKRYPNYVMGNLIHMGVIKADILLEPDFEELYEVPRYLRTNPEHSKI